MKKLDSISSQAILLLCNIFNRYLPALLLAHPLFMQGSAKGAASTIFTPLVWCGLYLNQWPPAPKADALPAELKERYQALQGWVNRPVIFWSVCGSLSWGSIILNTYPLASCDAVKGIFRSVSRKKERRKRVTPNSHEKLLKMHWIRNF